MIQAERPRPSPDSDSLPFWEGCRHKRLLLQRCLDCATPRFPPNRVCAECRSTRSEWTEASGKGSVFSWIVVRHPVPADVYGDEVPYVVTLIDLDEGTRFVSNIVDCPPDDIRSGMRVEVVFDDRVDPPLPKFRPAAEA